jgi:hypothetical protein
MNPTIPPKDRSNALAVLRWVLRNLDWYKTNRLADVIEYLGQDTVAYVRRQAHTKYEHDKLKGRNEL